MKLTGELIKYSPNEFVPINHEGLGHYLINEHGTIQNSRGKSITNRQITNRGYICVVLAPQPAPEGRSGKWFLISRLILETFRPIDEPELYEAHHLDRIVINNYLTNLEWRVKGTKHEHGVELCRALIKKYGESNIINYLLRYEETCNVIGIRSK